MKITKEVNQYYCKVCGAPVEHLYNHRCPFCRTLLDFNENIKNTIKIKPEELVDIELRETIFFPESFNIVLIFSGYKIEKPTIYEVDNNNFISATEVYLNPPKGAFCIQIKIEELREYGIEAILRYLCNIGVDNKEIYKLREQLINNKDIRRWL